MTSLVTANGSLLKRTVNNNLSPVGGLSGPFRPMWSSGDQSDDEGNGSGAPLASFQSIYSTQPLVAAAVDKLTRQGSTLPLKVYRRLENNERERVFDHPLEVLLRTPMPRRGPVHLKQWALMPLLIHGNALIAKFRAERGGPPTALLPVDWSCVEAYARQGGPVEVWATLQTGERRFIDAEDTVHFAWDQAGSELGVSPLEKLGTTVRMENAAQRYQIGSMRNGARPSSAVTTPPDANVRDPEVRKFYRDQIEVLHKGVDQAGKVALLSPGADIKVLSFSAADAQLIQQRYVDWEEIQSVYDMAGPLVGDLRHGTYSNVEELNKQLYKSVLRPWLTLIEEVLQAQLIDPEPGWGDLFVEFETAEVLKGDPKELAEALKLQVEAGLITRNEARKFLNMPRMDDPTADELTVNANNQAPLSDAGGGDDAPVLPSVSPQLS